jgi:hypothetical protein
VTVTTNGIIFQLFNIPVNQQVGTAAVVVKETALSSLDPSEVRNPTLNFSFVPFGSSASVSVSPAPEGVTSPPPSAPGAVRIDSPFEHLVRALAEALLEDSSSGKKEQIAKLLEQAFPPS